MMTMQAYWLKIGATTCRQPGHPVRTSEYLEKRVNYTRGLSRTFDCSSIHAAAATRVASELLAGMEQVHSAVRMARRLHLNAWQ